jgi:hypothetical protein
MEIVRDKKKFKETKVGQFLAVKAPKILDAVGDLLPDQGVTGIVKRLISSDQDISQADKIEFKKLLQQHEREFAAIEAQELASARTREVEFVKATGHVDHLMTFIGIVIFLSFIALQIVVVFFTVPEENHDSFIHMMTIIDVATGSILNYYFGSSKGSKEKTKLLNDR